MCFIVSGLTIKSLIHFVDLESIMQSEMCQMEKDKNLGFYSRGGQTTQASEQAQGEGWSPEGRGWEDREAGVQACGEGPGLRAEHAGEKTMSYYPVTCLGFYAADQWTAASDKLTEGT